MDTAQPPQLIALCAPHPQAGKSAIADHLFQKHGFATVKFASPMKAMVDALLGQACVPLMTRNKMLEGALKETPVASLGGVTPRRIMQTLGTEWGRNVMGEDFWVHIAMAVVDDYLKAGVRVVIDDMRFPNELDAVLDRGGVPVRVLRPGTFPLSPAVHASEGGLDNIQMATIENSGSLHALHTQADALAQGVLIRG